MSKGNVSDLLADFVPLQYAVDQSFHTGDILTIRAGQLSVTLTLSSAWGLNVIKGGRGGSVTDGSCCDEFTYHGCR
jgi:hypothetical protein